MKRHSSKDKENEMTETLDVLVLNLPNNDDRSYLLFEENSMIMFNHDEFLNGKPRPWSLDIRNTLKNTLEKLRFLGAMHDNLTRRNLIDAVKRFAKTDFSTYGCVCVAILTHGHDKPGFIRANNRWYNESEVFEHFDVAKNPSLAAKPIIFIIQASRGADAMATEKRRGSKPDTDLEKKSDYQLPLDAARVVFHNAYTGRECSRGSWLTQTLCEKINRCSSEFDLLELFRQALNSAGWIQDSMDWKQTLTFASTLTRHIYLENKKIDEPPSLCDEMDDAESVDDNIESDSSCNASARTSQHSKDNCAPEAMDKPNLTYAAMPEQTRVREYPQTYQLEKFQKNVMLIFNHEKFNDSAFGVRTGTAFDVSALESTFKRFRFEVTVHNNLEAKKLLLELQNFGKQDFTNYGCICVAILTHGDDRGVLLAADSSYKERELFACFSTATNSSLVAKPVIFLIQACRGRKLARTVQENPLERSSSVELDANRKKQSGYFLPTEADMIIFHSCFFGKASVRIRDEGTWFIQTICEELNRRAGAEHLEDIFRRVRVAIALQKVHENGKQMPVVTTTLLRKLYLSTYIS